MTYKQIEASRELRLWITQVIIPLIGIGAMIPEVREAVIEKAKKTMKKNKGTPRK
jgi:hypothetical protein